MNPVLVIQHFDADAPCYFAVALSEAGIEMDLRRTQDGDPVPTALGDYCGLVVLGGPQSASQDGRGYPTLEVEIELFQQAYESEFPAFGVCLGSQVLARAAGAKTYAGAQGKEIGWSTVKLTTDGTSHQFFEGLPNEITVMQWHGDTFDLPPDATLLATSDRYENQIFSWGSVIGLQPHLEIDTTDAVEAFIKAFPEEAELAAGGAQGLRESTPAALQQARHVMETVTDRWIKSLTD